MSLLKNYQLFFNFSLPRSGGLLLQSILAQNPRFFAPGPTPFLKALDAMRAAYWSEFRAPELVTGITEAAFLAGARGLADNFFLPACRSAVIDTSALSFLVLREFITKVTGPTKFVIVVRDLRQVACSWLCARRTTAGSLPDTEAAIAREISAFFSQALMQAGLKALENCISREIPPDIFVVRYEDLCFAPKATLKVLYDFLGFPAFNHDLQAISKPAGLFFGESPHNLREGALTSGIHDVEKILGKKQAEGIIFGFRSFFKHFYQEVMTGNPDYLLTSEEAEALARSAAGVKEGT